MVSFSHAGFISAVAQVVTADNTFSLLGLAVQRLRRSSAHLLAQDCVCFGQRFWVQTCLKFKLARHAEVDILGITARLFSF